MKNIFFVLSFLFFLGIYKSNAQDYKTGIGLRGGWTSGLTAKHFISDGRAIEGIFSSGWGWRGFQITGLYEFHKAAFAKDDVKGLFWFYGGGLHFGGGYSYERWHQTGPVYWNGYYERGHYSTFGIDGIFGLEYRIPDIPVTVAVDVKPFIEFSNYSGYPFRFWDGAFTIRYVF
jgi:hypothetical protein